MIRVVLLSLCVLAAVAPHAAAQSYQQFSDGLVAVKAKQVLDQDQRIAIDVCAQLMRQEKVRPLEIRLNLWGTSGRFVMQLSSVLYPELSSPVCQRIQLPPEVRDLGRWEIARFHVLREQAPLRAGRLNDAG
jgi:hypothetical protein